MMIMFGVVLLLPRAQETLATAAGPLASGANEKLNQVNSEGARGQFTIGLLLGAVWSPCVGPTLGGAIGLAASGENLLQATFTMLAFGLGVSTILILLSYGSRELLTKRKDRMMNWMPWAKPVMGVALLLVGFALLMQWNHAIDSWMLDIMPTWLQDLSVSV